MHSLFLKSSSLRNQSLYDRLFCSSRTKTVKQSTERSIAETIDTFKISLLKFVAPDKLLVRIQQLHCYSCSWSNSMILLDYHYQHRGGQRSDDSSDSTDKVYQVDYYRLCISTSVLQGPTILYFFTNFVKWIKFTTN